MDNTKVSVETFVGDVREVKFKLRQAGSRAPFDLTGAFVRLTLERLTPDSETPLEPIVCDPAYVGADFAQGVVVAVLGTTVTAVEGSYEFSLTIHTATQVRTVVTGRIDVRKRPGYPVVVSVVGYAAGDVSMPGRAKVALKFTGVIASDATLIGSLLDS